MGGPIIKDRLWFFGRARQFGSITVVEGAFANLYAGDARQWDYSAQRCHRSRATRTRRDIYSFRLTGAGEHTQPRVVLARVSASVLGREVEARHERRVSRERRSDWVGLGNFAVTPASPESWPGYHDAPYYVTQATWQSPFSSKILLEGGLLAIPLHLVRLRAGRRRSR